MYTSQVIEGGSDPVGSEYFYRIRHGFLSDSFRSESDKNRVGSDRFFNERCRILMISDTDLIENDRIYSSDRLTWVVFSLSNSLR